MPKDNKQQNQNTQSQQDDNAPVFMEEATPPILTTPPDISNSSPVDTNTASSAPSDDLPKSTPLVGTTAPKKKYGGNRVIATILGVLLLVGGVGAGVFLVQESQDIRERAQRETQTDQGGPLCAEYPWMCEQGIPEVNTPPATPPGSTTYCNPNTGNCSVTHPSCGGVCGEYRIVESGPGNPRDWPGCSVTPTDCPPGSPRTNTVARSRCQSKDSIWQCNGWVLGSAEEFGPDCDCITIPAGCGECELYWTNPNTDVTSCIRRECWEESQECSGRTINTYSCAVQVTASCQNVKAYNTSWVELTSSQLSQLGANAQVNFCVTGVASGGSFTKARFTVNNESLPETTTKRPNSNDFCSTYVIKSGINTYNVSAQIYHDSLGWK